PEPPREWLGGAYLAGAGAFPEVPAYWKALDAFLDRLKEHEEAHFLTAVDAHLATAVGAEGQEERAWVRDRLLAGFRAARHEREVVYAALDELFAAATDLHDFLVRNEARITYAPAAGG